MLITFEADVLGTIKQLGEHEYDAVIPSVSLLAEFPVAVVDKVVDKRGTRDIATAYGGQGCSARFWRNSTSS